MRVSGPMFGVDLQKRPEIGRYRSRLAIDEVARLKDLTLSGVEEVSAVADEPVLPGTMFLEFGYRDPAKRINKSASFAMTNPYPPAMKRLDDAMLGLARRLLDHPLATLKGSASFKESRIAQKDELELILMLRNSGSVPISICNPAAAETDDRVGLEVLIEKDLPEEDLEGGDSKQISVKCSEVSQVKAPGSELKGEVKSVVRLDPNEDLVLSLRVRRHVFLGVGSYRVSVAYTSPSEDIPDEEAVEGYLEVPVGKFSVNAQR